MTTKRDTYQIVTDRIIAALEKCGPFERPWVGQALTMPRNAVSGHQYRGTNVLSLWISALEAGYAVNEWATFKQWSERGASVRKGETGTPVLWFSMLERKGDAGDASAEGEDDRRIPCARLSWVFNAEQVDGYTPETLPTPEENRVSPIERAESLIAASGARIIHQGTQAYFSRATNEIHLPPRHYFTGTSTSNPTEAYYSTALHELTHWTGPQLDREFGKRFGDEAYAFEELVAELGAAFLCTQLGVANEPREDHASYLANWLRILKDDRKAIVTAASKAAEACDFLLAFDTPLAEAA